MTDSTAPQVDGVRFGSFRYEGFDADATAVGKDQFLNPVLAGFHPDPSVCRVGRDFYLVTSTFAYWPGLPIYHSRDLVNWRQIGSVLTRPSQTEVLRDANTATGVFAATIHHHEGVFYVASTLIGRGGGNFVVTAKDPAGPWSDPIWFRDIHGIDPSLFFDTDGRTYIVHNDEAPNQGPLYDGHRTIRLQEVNLERGVTLGDSHVLVNGGVEITAEPIWIEGPHLFKKDGWYMLSAAEGGTGPNHSQVIFRSRLITGPYEPFAGNPILTQRHLPPDRPRPVTCTGHADLIELPNGDWWVMFLACRPDAHGNTLTGRETFLLPMKWRDGWPCILAEEKTVPYILNRPPIDADALPREDTGDEHTPTTGTLAVVDDFDNASKQIGWMTYRAPQQQWWRIEDGLLTIVPMDVRLTSRTENASYLCRRLQHAVFQMETSLEVPVGRSACGAGLAVFMDERHHVFFGVRLDDGAVIELFIEKVSADCRASQDEVVPECLVSQVLPPGTSAIELQIAGEDSQLTFNFRTRGRSEWRLLLNQVDGAFLSEHIAGGFTGVTVGLHARRP